MHIYIFVPLNHIICRQDNIIICDPLYINTHSPHLAEIAIMTSSESLSLADHDDILGFVIGLTIPEFQASERDRVQDQNFEKRVH